MDLSISFYISALSTVVGREATARRRLKGERERINKNRETQRYPEISILRIEVSRQGFRPPRQRQSGEEETAGSFREKTADWGMSQFSRPLNNSQGSRDGICFL